MFFQYSAKRTHLSVLWRFAVGHCARHTLPCGRLTMRSTPPIIILLLLALSFCPSLFFNVRSHLFFANTRQTEKAIFVNLTLSNHSPLSAGFKDVVDNCFSFIYRVRFNLHLDSLLHFFFLSPLKISSNPESGSCHRLSLTETTAVCQLNPCSHGKIPSQKTV